jgi:site-specific DNA-methyltransferase (adenine-specific)
VATIDRYLGKVFCCDALDLLRTMPVESVNAVIADAMYGTSKNFRYEWGLDPAKGDPLKHWQYHEPIYQECLRVLRPGGVLAWGQGAKFCQHFPGWFGDHRLWTITRFRLSGKAATGHVWIVQTKERQPIEFPHRDSLVMYQDVGMVRKLHPCIKPLEELAFLIESLTKPGEIVLDCFCGLGSTLLACQRLKRLWIGCDISRPYCRVALKRLKHDATGQPMEIFSITLQPA